MNLETQRPPHSSRVATLTVALAETVSSLSEGRFADISYNPDQFNTIRYASLLHDFGKIGVREKVLVKSKKLYPEEQQAVMDRFRLIRWRPNFNIPVSN